MCFFSLNVVSHCSRSVTGRQGRVLVEVAEDSGRGSAADGAVRGGQRQCLGAARMSHNYKASSLALLDILTTFLLAEARAEPAQQLQIIVFESTIII
jgi:hypothetical protein